MKKRIRLTVAIALIAIPFAVLSLLSMLLGNLLVLLHLRRASEKTVHFLLDILIFWILFCLGVRLHTEGKENIPAWGSKVCYIANHQSMMDIPVLYGAGMWCGLVAKQELFRIPVLHGLLKVLRCVAIDRGSLRASLKSILKGAEQISSGYPMGIFPEGTRNRGEELSMLPFKDGALKISTKTGCAIVPISMNNTAEIFENHFPKIKKTHVVIEYGKPIYPDQLDKDTKRHIGDYVENVIRETIRKNAELV